MFMAYKITCLVNGKIYIGITTRSLKQRWWCHTWSARNKGGATAIAAAIKKYGEENFRIEEIGQAPDFEALKRLEVALIAQENSVAPAGYNLTTGGEGTHGYKHSEELRRKHGDAVRGKKWTAKQTEHMRTIMKGRTITWGDKIAIAKKGQGPSTEQSAAHSAKMRGRKKPPRSPEHRIKLAANTTAQWARRRAVDPAVNRLLGKAP